MERLLIIVAITTQMAVSSANNNITISKDCMDKKGLCLEKPNNYDNYLELMENSLRMSDLQLRSSDEDDGLSDYDVFDDGENCPYRVRVIQPFVYVGKDTEMLIVQTAYFKQRVETVECMPSDYSQLNMNNDECFRRLAVGWTGHCRPKETAVNLIAYNIKLNITVSLQTNIPVLCYCRVTL